MIEISSMIKNCENEKKYKPTEARTAPEVCERARENRKKAEQKSSYTNNEKHEVFQYFFHATQTEREPESISVDSYGMG